MITEATLLRLVTWLSPAFPTGAFAWSGGLEATDIEDAGALADWLDASLTCGPIRNDATLCAAAHDGEDAAELALALASSPSRLAETTEQGAAFLAAAALWDEALTVGAPDPCPLPVAVGHVGWRAGLERRALLTAFVQSSLVNAVQAAQRLGRIGQRDGVRILARLEPVVLACAGEAAASSLDDLATATVSMDIAAMRHETLPTRIFRS